MKIGNFAKNAQVQNAVNAGYRGTAKINKEIFMNTVGKFESEWPVDVYFLRAGTVASCLPDKWRVTYRYFARNSGLFFGTPFIQSILKELIASVPGLPADDWPIVRALPEGTAFVPKQCIMEIDTPFEISVAAETSILGILSLCGTAYRMSNIVMAARGRPVYAFEARHFPPSMAALTACAAKLGGASGTSSTTGADLAQTYSFGAPEFESAGWVEGAVQPTFLEGPVGTNPHASATIMPNEGPDDYFLIDDATVLFRAPADLPEVRNAEIFLKAVPGIPSLVLNDFSGREMDASRTAVEILGDDPFFWGVRCDTCGERFHQGARWANNANMASIVAGWKCTDNKERLWEEGPGVTIELLQNVRKAMDEAGGQKHKIMASSGFNEKKTKFFDESGTPFDAVGTGSFVHMIGVTADIVSRRRTQDKEWQTCVKAGREWLAEQQLKGLAEVSLV